MKLSQILSTKRLIKQSILRNKQKTRKKKQGRNRSTRETRKTSKKFGFVKLREISPVVFYIVKNTKNKL